MEMSFFGLFSCREDIETYFQIELADDCEILFASYEEDDLESQAYVLFRQQEMLFEVDAQSEGFLGLESQWEPGLTTASALTSMLERGDCLYLISKEAARYLTEVVEELRRG